ncbi:glycosyltransferase family 4 protein [Flavobacterium sp. XGLA_31]|uniref:glycosyltransferase family 4 protein n=1 Tax=Flavobacterium sp. XGLA_31 TaxID=3447666 RepID=UPI003F3DE543
MDKPIKIIAVICNYKLLPERVGGMDYFFWMFDKKCKENDIQVDWFFPNTSNHGLYKELTIYHSHHKNVERFFLENYSQNCYSHIITHFVELCTPFYKQLKRVNKAKVIAVDHNPRPLSGYPLKKRFEKRVKGILYSRYIDLFVGVSHYTVTEILNDFGSQIKNKTITLYNGVVIDDIKVRTERNFENPTFLVASHLRESKGIQDLIDAVAMLTKDEQRKIKIDVYGEGPYASKLLEKVKVLQLEASFDFKGSVADLKDVFCQYDYMLQPTHMECFSLSILESLAANVPVITTNVGGNEEAITDGVNGYIFKAKDIVALKTILHQILANEIKIEANTRTLVEERFSLKTMVDNHFSLIR